MWTADIGYITDMHFTIKKNPKWFVGSSFLEVQLQRLEQFVEMANKASCQGLIFGGDIFDDWDDFSMKMFCDITDILETFNGDWIRSCIGNHDILQSNQDSVRYSGVRALQLWKPDIFEVYEDDERRVYPIHWWHPFTKKLLTEKSIKLKEYSKIDIIVTHAQVGPYSTPHCIGVDEIEVTGPDFILFGDQHLGWSPRLKKGTWYVNPGAFSNMTSDDIKRVPKCAFIKDHEVKQFKLMTTPAAHDSSFSTKLSKLTELKESLSSSEIHKDLSFVDAVKEVAKSKKYSKEVSEWFLKKIVG